MQCLLLKMEVHIFQIVWLEKNVQLFSHKEEYNYCFALIFEWSGAQCTTKRKYKWQNLNLTIASYSLSRPFDSFHLRNETEASTLAGDEVFGSFNKEIILNRIVLKSTERKDPKLKYIIASITTLYPDAVRLVRLNYNHFQYFFLLISYFLDARTYRTFCVGFHLSDASSPLKGSSVGGWRIEIQTSPF